VIAPTQIRSPFKMVLSVVAAMVLWWLVLAYASSPAWAADYTVNSNADADDGACNTEPTDPDCTLREAIKAANTSSGVADTINFDLGSEATITLSSQLFGLRVSDPGGLTIDGGSADITVSGNNEVNVFNVDGGAKLTLNNLTVAKGKASFNGGGIYNKGTLTVNNSTFSGNIGEAGGGISNRGGTLEVNNSTFSDAFGGGIFNRSTFSGPATLKNTIVANSIAGGNCIGTIIDGGGNLDDGTTCGFTDPSSKSNTPAGLGPAGLKSNGGPTETIALCSAVGTPTGCDGPSAAIDAAVSCPPPASDQRGVSRPQGSACDIGAFEVEPPPDTTAPTTDIALDPATPNGDNGWYNSDVHLTLSASDGTGGSGVAETRCVLDPAGVPSSFDELPMTACPYLGSGADVSANAQHTLYAASIDNEGNKETPVVSKRFKIDTQAPKVIGTFPRGGGKSAPRPTSGPPSQRTCRRLASSTPSNFTRRALPTR
jgi:CSLREA domain-containing protein